MSDKLTPLDNRVVSHNDFFVDIPEHIKLSPYGDNNPDVNLFNSLDQEIIEHGGSDLYYIKFMRSENYDTLYEEDRDKVYSNKTILRGHYNPMPFAQEMSQFGIDIKNDQSFVFNKDYIMKKLGRAPIAGDIIQPRFQNVFFEITEVKDESFHLYGVYHLTLHAKVLKDVPSVMKELQVTP